MFLDLIHGTATESEYCVVSGKVLISRITFDEHLNSMFCIDEGNLDQKTVDAADPVVGKIKNGRVVFQTVSRVNILLQDDEVEVGVRASGVNGEGIQVINGTDVSTAFSHEISRIVHKVGQHVTDLKPGDLVFGFSFNKLATLQRVPRYMVRRFTDERKMSTMAGLTIVRGDVSVKADVDRAIASAHGDRPIRGVIHAAMVLRDGLFHNMTYENWTASMRPKVTGAQNLHDALALHPLDFFVMTSSISGIRGTPAQLTSGDPCGSAARDAVAAHMASKLARMLMIERADVHVDELSRYVSERWDE